MYRPWIVLASPTWNGSRTTVNQTLVVVVPAAPDVTASGERVVRYYQDHGDGVRVAMWLTTWSMVPFVLLVAHLRRRLAIVGRDVMLLGAAALLVTTIVWSWFNLGLALHPHTLDPHSARTIADVSAYFGPVATVSILLFIAPVGLAAWRSEAGLPRWLGWFTAAFALEQSIETITILGTRGFFGPGGGMGVLGLTLFVIWVITVGAATSAATPGPLSSTR